MTDTKLIYPIGNYSILFQQDTEHSTHLACAALLLLLMLTLFLNSFVLLSVLFSPLRSTPYNASLACVAAASVLDGMFNVTSSIVFHASWSELPHQYGENGARKLCRANAAILQITGMVQSFAFAALMFDRQSMLLVRERRNEEDFAEALRRRGRVNTTLKWAVILSVLTSTIMAQPLGLGLVPSTLFEQRMSCSPAYVSSKPASVFLAILTACVYFIAWAFTLRSSFIIVRRVLNERRRLIELDLVARQRAVERRSPVRRVSNSNTELWNQIWGPGDELPLYVLAGLLISSFLISVAPNIIAVQVTQFYRNYDTSQDFYFPNRTLPPLDLRQIRTDIFDSIFAWTRHGYNVFSPALVLLLHSEIRRQCRITFCCCWLGKNEVPQGRSRSIVAFVRELKGRTKKKTIVDYRTPVLFATSQGLHLRTVREDQFADEEPQFLLRFCDLTLDDPPRPTSARKQVEGKPSPNGNLLEVLPQPRQQEKLNETFLVSQPDREAKLGETYVKYSTGFDTTIDARHRRNTIELSLISENSNSLLTLSQRMRMRDS